MAVRFQDIDWNRMWQEAKAGKSWTRKKNTDWDKRASSFAQRNINSPYVEKFLSHLHLDPEDTVLDVGCGPGTLALPLARQTKKVTALDFSQAMLDELQRLAAENGLTNINTMQASWEDDWQQKGVASHDVAVASRSLSVNDLQAALRKLDHWATKAVYIADRVGAGPLDPDIFAAIGRNFKPGPDYIYTLNMLYSLGIHAHVDYIILDPCREYSSPEEALHSSAWMLDDLTPGEEKKLASYIQSNLSQTGPSTWTLHRRVAPKWALLWWRKDG